ncbi:ABC transporter substrate-binding protein [Sinorhizobium sp. 7-81]|uniref:ABC transporter substrate-binding protein n=1 Tax=Sinorhizobium sp. 8-89 TaxID=3049089 RepID=UPI0024C44B63|nr:ABC transporter substrate-binding protein [Sinorhizobium sp. 8-89]MDK1494775.1 ABC transporter substrate-binding protein [Sinorhizobium sp. 8-89]
MIRLIRSAVLAAGVCLSAVQIAAAQDLVIGMQEVRPRFDPAIETGNTGIPLSNAVFETLIRRDYQSDGKGTGAKLVPALAESWHRVDDLTLELKLRSGLTFHNGDPLTSKDVKFTFDRILDPKSQYARSQFQYENIARVEAPDDLTVRVVTKKPDPTIELMLTFPASSIVPKDYYEKVGFEAFGQKPVGAGPYRFVQSVDDDHVTLEAFPVFWGGKPPAEKLVFREIPDLSARITALANGEVEIINNVTPDQIPAVDNLDCCEVRSVMANSHLLNYRTSNPLMADKRFRQGLNLAIDRELLSKALWNDKAEVLHSHQYAEWGDLYNADRPTFPYNPDRARKLIEESGYKGEEIQFTTSPVYYTNGLAAAEAIVSMWQKVGVNAKVEVNESWYEKSNDDPGIEVRNISDWGDLPDPNVTIMWSWTITALWDGNKAFQDLGHKAATTLDRKERFGLYQQMLDMFEDEAPGTVLYRVPDFYGVRRDTKWQPYTNYVMDFRPGSFVFGEGK